jgi:hypothetical protein
VLDTIGRSALRASALYAVLAVALTWPLLPRLGRDLPADLVDPLFTCWALGWNFHAAGLSSGGPPVASLWDANIFHPSPRTLARSEHFIVQAAMGAPVYALTRDLVFTHNLLFLATFVLSGLFMFLWARDETGDEGAALGAGLLYAFAFFRWSQLSHLGALSAQWMPLALLLVRRVARAQGRAGLGWTAALAAVTALQVASSGYYLLFFPPFLAAWAAVEAARTRSLRAWLRLLAAGLLAALLALPVVLPYVALRASGAARGIDAVIEHSADLLSWLTAPEMTRVWGPVLDFFPRGEARLFPGLVTPLLALGALAAALGAARAGSPVDGPLTAARRRLSAAALVLGAAGLLGVAAVAAGGLDVALGPLHLRALTFTRPLLMIALAAVMALASRPGLRAAARAFVTRREVVAALLAVVAAWLSLGPLVTCDGWPSRLPSLYRLLYEHVPGFSSGRSAARFAMMATCFGVLAAAYGLRHLRATARGRRLAVLGCALFLVETAPLPLPLSRTWGMPGVDAVPRWNDGQPSPIVASIRDLPADAVLAFLPFREMFHEARAMFDSTFHWRRMVNGYSSWMPPGYEDLAFAARDPLRAPAETLAALRAAGVTHVVVHERAWRGVKGSRVSERLAAAGARPLATAGDMTLLAVR